jgi:hypothetical protein
MSLDKIEQQEIQALLKKYQCKKDVKIILDNLCSSGRINRASAIRRGFSDKNINASLTRLRLALAPWNPKE